MERLFEYWLFENISKFNVKEQILKLEDNKLAEIIYNSFLYSLKRDSEIIVDEYSFNANSYLSGSDTVCGQINCRIHRVMHLAKFAMMYATQVIIDHPFDKYYGVYEFSLKKRIDLIDDFLFLYEIRKFLDEGLFIFTRSKDHFCSNCFDSLIYKSEDFKAEVTKLKNNLLREYEQNAKCIYINNEEKKYIIIQGPDKLIHDGSVVCVLSNKDTKELLKHIDDINEIEIPKKVVKDFGIIDGLVNEFYDGILTQNWRKRELDINYVTHNKFEIDMLNSMKNSKTKLINSAMVDGLTHIAPYLNNVGFDDLIDFRNAEEEAFNVYRNALRCVINDIDSQNPKMYKEAFVDIVKPELDRLNLIHKNSLKRFKRTSTRNVLLGGCIVGAGMMTGIIPPELPKVVAAIGGIEALLGIGSTALNSLNSSEADVENNDFYYLWKLYKH